MFTHATEWTFELVLKNTFKLHVFDGGFADLQMRLLWISNSSRDVFERCLLVLTKHKTIILNVKCKMEQVAHTYHVQFTVPQVWMNP